MAIEAVMRVQEGTSLTLKSSGGSAAMSFASKASGTYWQSAKIDFGATRAPLYAVFADLEFAATPTTNKAVKLWANPSSSGTAATDNRGGCSGSDGSYTGYSSNAAEAIRQLDYVGTGWTTAQATATVQKIFIGYYAPKRRYASFVGYQISGAALHSSETNQVITFVPVEPTQEPS